MVDRTGRVAGQHAGDDADDRDETLSTLVYRKIKADILWGRAEPDQSLRSDDLKRRYDVGISPLREALTRLTCEGLVVRSAQRGFRVSPLTSAIVLEIAEARVMVETEALRASIERGGLDWEKGIVAAAHVVTKTLSEGSLPLESEEWAAQHRQFHMALLAACGSSWLLRTASNLYDHAERHRIVGEIWRVGLEASGAISGRNRVLEHKNLAEAVLDRDFDVAAERLRRHNLLTAQSVVHVLDGQMPSIGGLQRLRHPRGAASRKVAN